MTASETGHASRMDNQMVTPQPSARLWVQASAGSPAPPSVCTAAPASNSHPARHRPPSRRRRLSMSMLPCPLDPLEPGEWAQASVRYCRARRPTARGPQACPQIPGLQAFLFLSQTPPHAPPQPKPQPETTHPLWSGLPHLHPTLCLQQPSPCPNKSTPTQTDRKFRIEKTRG